MYLRTVIFVLCFAVFGQLITVTSPDCSSIYIGSSCSLVCSTAELSAPSIITIPSNEGIESLGNIPTNLTKVVSYVLNGLYGTYNGPATTMPHIFVDCGNVPGQTVELAVEYDWTSDGVWDRTEVFDKYPCNPVNDFEEYFSNPPISYIVTLSGNAYKTFAGGSIKLSLWQSSGVGTPQIQVKADSISGGQLSYLSLPYTSYQSVEVNDTAQLCERSCVFNRPSDACGVCLGPGPTGCDNKCFSTAVIDGCGVCGGLGPSGCDLICNSTKRLDACGVCGGNGTCTLAPGTFGYITTMFPRAGCKDLMPTNFPNLTMDPYPLIEIPFSNFERNTETIQKDPLRKVTFTVTGLRGYYDIGARFTNFSLSVDALNVPGQAVAVAVYYDWTGNGVWDRVELYKEFTPNPTRDWEIYSAIGTTGGIANPCLDCVLPAFQNLVYGAVKIEIFSAYESGCCPIYLDPLNSFLRIPYVGLTLNRVTDVCPGIDSCNCVAFRFDEMQDYYLEDTQKAVMNAFLAESVGYTAAINIASFEGQSNFRVFIKSAILDPTRKLEVANFAQINSSWSRNTLTLQLINQTALFYNTFATGLAVPKVLVPDNFHNLTRQSAAAAGYTDYSTNPFDDLPMNYTVKGQSFYRFPAFIETADPYYPIVNEVQDFSQILQDPINLMIKIKAQLSARGFAVVALRFNEFAYHNVTDDNYYDIPNAGALVKITQLIQNLKTAGIAIKTVSQISFNDVPRPDFTTNAVTTGSFTSGDASTGAFTSAPLVTTAIWTTSPITTHKVTTGGLTTARVTTGITSMATCNCVAFRIDAVQDYFVSAGVIAVMDLFKDLNAPLNLAIVANHLGQEFNTLSRIQTAAADQNLQSRVEILVNGWDYEDFSSKTYEEQVILLNQAKANIQDLLQVTPASFVPPDHFFNADTLRALKDTGYTHMSSRLYADPPPYGIDQNQILRFPANAFGFEPQAVLYLKPIEKSLLWSSIFDQLFFYGFSVVELNGGEFLKWDPLHSAYSTEVNATHLSDLSYLVQALRARGVRICRIADIEDYYENTLPIVGSGLPDITTGEIVDNSQSRIQVSLGFIFILLISYMML